MSDPKSTQNILDEIISGMPEQEFTEFFKALASPSWQSALGQFIQKNIELGKFFQADSHRIELSHHGNSKIFKISSLSNDAEQSCVLKLAMQPITSIDRDLQQKTDFISPIREMEQTVSYQTRSGQDISDGRMQILPFYSSGSLYDCGFQRTTEERLGDTAKIFREMTRAFQSIQASGYIFTDAKNSNWLLNNDGKLIITDTKCFYHLDSDGKFRTSSGASFTVAMTPPELRIPGMNIINGQSDKIECSPEKVHAYMLGKNIYQYLTQTQLREFFIPNA